MSDGGPASTAKMGRAPALGLKALLDRLARRGPAGARPLDVDALHRAATRRTGLTDFGDPFYREGLTVLARSVNEAADLSPFGRRVLRRVIIGHLCNRLRVEERLKRSPEIRDLPLPGPVFVVGFPRTGTTLLQNLLARLPGLRFLDSGEAFMPSPLRLGAAARALTRCRIGLSLRLWYCLAPELSRLHPLRANEPTECSPLLANAAATEYYAIYLHAPRFLQWLGRQGEEYRVKLYRHYAMQLRILQWRRPQRRWLLKCPVHMVGLSAIHEVFPEARIVRTHRDLARAVPSLCSLAAAAYRLFSDGVDRHAIGRYVLASAHRSTAVGRGPWPPQQWADVPYPQLVADSVGTVGRLAGQFGLELPPRAETTMRDWLRAHPSPRRPRRYRPEDFGLSAERLSRAFSAYHRRFDLVEEN